MFLANTEADPELEPTESGGLTMSQLQSAEAKVIVDERNRRACKKAKKLCAGPGSSTHAWKTATKSPAAKPKEHQKAAGPSSPVSTLSTDDADTFDDEPMLIAASTPLSSAKVNVKMKRVLLAEKACADSNSALSVSEVESDCETSDTGTEVTPMEVDDVQSTMHPDLGGNCTEPTLADALSSASSDADDQISPISDFEGVPGADQSPSPDVTALPHPAIAQRQWQYRENVARDRSRDKVANEKRIKKAMVSRHVPAKMPLGTDDGDDGRAATRACELEEPREHQSDYRVPDSVRARMDKAEVFLRHAVRYAMDYVMGDIPELPTLRFKAGDVPLRTHSAQGSRRDVGAWRPSDRRPNVRHRGHRRNDGRRRPVIIDERRFHSRGVPRQNWRARVHRDYAPLHVPHLRR